MILSNWRFAVSKRSLISLCLRNRLVSFAYMTGSNKCVAFFRSFTYSKNSSDPGIEPCGTPRVIVSRSAFSSLFIWMNCFLFDKWFLNHEWFRSFTPYNSGFLRSIEWSTASKALDKSMKTPRVCLLCSKYSRIRSTNYTIACSVECPVWKRNCLG